MIYHGIFRKILAYFKKMTMGKAMVMGRKTYESIGRPLPGRLNIVVTRNKDFTAEGVVVVHDLNEAIEKAKEYNDEVMIIGGAEIFRMTLEIADRLYITFIQKHFEGDTFFPAYGPEWKLVSTSEDKVTEDGTPFHSLFMKGNKIRYVQFNSNVFIFVGDHSN